MRRLCYIYYSLQAILVHGFQLLEISPHSVGNSADCQRAKLFDLSAAGIFTFSVLKVDCKSKGFHYICKKSTFLSCIYGCDPFINIYFSLGAIMSKSFRLECLYFLVICNVFMLLVKISRLAGYFTVS